MESVSFVREVLLPLTAGGAITVRGPIDADDLHALAEERGRMAGLAELAEARRVVIGRILRDAKLYAIGAGTNEIRRMLIGRELFDGKS